MNICDVIAILNMYILLLLCCKIVFDEESGVEDLYSVPENIQKINVTLVIVYFDKTTIKSYLVLL